MGKSPDPTLHLNHIDSSFVTFLFGPIGRMDGGQGILNILHNLTGFLVEH